MRLKSQQVTQIINKIGEYEGYKNLKPFHKGSRTTFISSTGEILILRTTSSIEQKDRGSFCQITDIRTCDYIKTHKKGFLYIVVFLDEKAVFFKQDLKKVIEFMNNFKVDAKGRYLGRIWIKDAMQGHEFITIDGAYSKDEGTFVCEHIKELDDNQVFCNVIEKQNFKEKNQEQNIFNYHGLKVQIVNHKEYTLDTSFKPSVYLYEFLNKKNKVVAKYVGKSYCGLSGRLCGHLTHKELKIDKYLEEAKDKGYLLRITCLAICGSKIEMNETEKKWILEIERQEYNSITGENTDYRTYLPFKELFKNKILNTFLI